MAPNIGRNISINKALPISEFTDTEIPSINHSVARIISTMENILIFFVIFLVLKPFSKICGSGEIRTHGALRHSCFQDKCDRPLCHASLYLFKRRQRAFKICFYFNPTFLGNFEDIKNLQDRHCV